MKASVFMAMRSQLISAICDVDEEISNALRSPKSQRAHDRAKALFAERQRLADELEHYGVFVDPHPAV